ncbi:MAG: phospho-N-acetylmuramoyl-pentapeptide-transferase [Alphaproteobacteria bacterium]|nr:phospho-N-acetylmuramoyl-pentapeptide-transferase [Alphaproteobacteria bacterium]
MLLYLFDVLGVSSVSATLALRCFGAFFVSLFLALVFGGKLIDFLHKHQKKGQPIREDGPQSHLETKKGTPTMGGIMILVASVFAFVLFCDLKNIFVWVGIAVLVIFGLVGFVDDYLKVTKQSSNAMTAKMKLLLQFATAMVAILLVTYNTPENVRFVVNIPYISNWGIDIWWFYIPFAMIVIAGASNGVNLSDGLDGLASGLLSFVFVVFMILAYIAGGVYASQYNVSSIPGCSDVAVMCAAVVGGCLGFLWFNAKPAQVFMGDTGSLALGAFLGLVAVMLKQELLLAVAGGVFVMESISVMIQVGWFKYTGGKRFFKMAPIHHHFEQLGWPETKVVFRFWLIGIVLAVLALVSLYCK